jgi:hypothetical protein
MKLLKLGDRFLNVDLVTEYTVEDTSVIAHFGPGHTTRFTRNDATLLRQWLDRTAMDITQDEADAPDQFTRRVERQARWRDPDDLSRPSRR